MLNPKILIELERTVSCNWWTAFNHRGVALLLVPSFHFEQLLWETSPSNYYLSSSFAASTFLTWLGNALTAQTDKLKFIASSALHLITLEQTIPWACLRPRPQVRSLSKKWLHWNCKINELLNDEMMKLSWVVYLEKITPEL